MMRKRLELPPDLSSGAQYPWRGSEVARIADSAVGHVNYDFLHVCLVGKDCDKSRPLETSNFILKMLHEYIVERVEAIIATVPDLGLGSPPITLEASIRRAAALSSGMDLDSDDFSTLPLDGPSSTNKENGSSLHRLQRAWISERCAPDILPYETRLIDTVSTRLREQVVTTHRYWFDEGQIAWIEEALLSGERDTKSTFRTIIVQTEVERVKFLIRSYLRARLYKVPLPSFPPDRRIRMLSA